MRSWRPVLRRFRSRRAWRIGVAVDRRAVRPLPLGLTLALTPSRTTVRATSTFARVTNLVHHHSTVLRSAAPVYTLTTAQRGYTGPRTVAPPSHGVPARVPPVERVHTRLRVEQLRSERHLRTETMPSVQMPAPHGPRGAQGPPGKALTLVHAAPATTSAATPAMSETLPAPAEAQPSPAPPVVPEPVAFSLPHVDALASQVLDRIERRAIAQRERMGRI